GLNVFECSHVKSNDLNRYFHLKEAELPLAPYDANGIINFVDLLLIFR
ncbi:21637_t:CDS:1, partial [Gigaspora rosea]